VKAICSILDELRPLASPDLNDESQPVTDHSLLTSNQLPITNRSSKITTSQSHKTTNQAYIVNTRSYSDQIIYVTDRLGHDRRYAINSSKIQLLLNWQPIEVFETGLRKTIECYLRYLS
jgi:dTDP-D-glucose 4,6-dehydratase